MSEVAQNSALSISQKKIIDECGKTGMIEPTHSQPRMGEVRRLIANASKAKEMLGWEAQYDFEKGLREFIQWYKNYGFE